MSLIAEKTSVLHRSIRDANDAANEDSKSSAGDKFETGREMITQEIAKATQQLATLGEMRRALEKIRPNRALESVGLGALAHTSEGWFFFSVSLGKIQVEGQEVYALSMASPMAQAMAGAVAGKTISFRGRDIHITQVR